MINHINQLAYVGCITTYIYLHAWIEILMMKVIFKHEFDAYFSVNCYINIINRYPLYISVLFSDASSVYCGIRVEKVY